MGRAYASPAIDAGNLDRMSTITARTTLVGILGVAG